MEFFKWEIIYQRGFSIGSILLAFRATCVRATFDDSPCLCRIFSNVSMPHPTHPTHGCNKLMTDDSQCLCRSSRTSACPTPPHPTPVMAATSLWLMTPSVCASLLELQHAPPHPPQSWLQQAYDWWLPVFVQDLLERQHAPPHPPHSWLQQAYDWWLPVFVQVFSNVSMPHHTPPHPSHGCNKLMTDDSPCLCRIFSNVSMPHPTHPTHGCNKLMTDDSQCLCRSSRTSACPTPPHPTPVMAATSLWLMTPSVCASLLERQHAPPHPTPPQSWLQQAYDWWLPVFVQVFLNVSMPQLIGAGSHFTLHPISR